MSRKSFWIAVGLTWIGAAPGCSGDGEGQGGIAPGPYAVLTDVDITYANGLAHSRNSTSAFSVPVQLDVYYPDHTSTNRPVMMFVHGGGFTGGSKTKPEIVEMANYYASRGWVYVSIDYRTAEELGSIEDQSQQELLDYYRGIAPQEWIEAVLEGAQTSKEIQQAIAM